MTKKANAARRARKPKHKPGRAKREESGSSSKKATCVTLLERAEGASIAELQQATGWQPHSVRGFLAGTVKKKLGLNLASTKEKRGRIYRITPTKGAT